jgi:hypothetical protein
MPQKQHPDRTARTQIIVAIIGLIGLVTVALIANMDKLIPRKGNDVGNNSNSNRGTGPSPSPIPSSTQASGSSNCIDKDFAGAETVELETSTRLQLKHELVIVYRKDLKPLGALKLKYIPNQNLDYVKYELESAMEVVDSQCHEVKELSNMEGPAGQKVGFWLNYNYLRIQFGNQYYRLRFSSDGSIVDAQFITLTLPS